MTRERNPYWDALVLAWPWLSAKAISTRTGGLARKLSECGENAPEVLPAVVERYKAKWPKVDCTPEAVLRHWHMLLADVATEAPTEWRDLTEDEKADLDAMYSRKG